MATEEDTAAGLIDWVNSLEAAEPIYTVDELNDGAIIWKTLRKDLQSFPLLATNLLNRTNRPPKFPRLTT